MTMPTARIATIRARAAAEAANYTIEAWYTDKSGFYRTGAYPAFTVRHTDDDARAYDVDLNFETCDCPAFKQEGYCKHCAMCQAELAYLADLDRQAAEQDANEEARADLYHLRTAARAEREYEKTPRFSHAA